MTDRESVDIRTRFRRIVNGLRDPVVVEIGACVGQDTWWLALPPVKQCIAVEPDPRNIAALAAAILPAVVTVARGAISAERGRRTLWMSAGRASPERPDNTASSAILRPTGHLTRHPCYTFGETTEVECWTLDDLYRDFAVEQCDFIWCDAQGSEADIVRGGQMALARTRYFYCEYIDEDPVNYESQAKLGEWLPFLPGRWSVVERYADDVLLYNHAFDGR